MFLSELEEFVVSDKPDSLDHVYYFFLERGILPSDLDDLPIPYVIAMLKTHSHVLKQQEKAAKRKR